MSKLTYRRVNDRVFIVDLGDVTIGTIWRGSGRSQWAGTRYANGGHEGSFSTRKALVEHLASLPRLYDRRLEIGEKVSSVRAAA